MKSNEIAERPKEEVQESNESVDLVLEHMIQEGREIGSGKDAVVFKVDLAALPQNERDALVEKEIIFPSDEVDAMAAKILKVCNHDLGDHEFRMQKRARDILVGEKDVARVPDIASASGQHISEKTRDYLNRHGTLLKDEVEILMMDFIDGQDLGSMVYDFVLRQMGYENDYIADLTYEQKDQLVGQELGFELPNLESAHTPEEHESAKAVVFDRNENKMIKYLRRMGFRLDPKIFEKVDNAVRIFNNNGIYHNDLHRQNVMVDGDGEVYIIDFGRSGSEKRKDGIADTLFSKKWRTLSISEEEEINQQHKEERTQVERMQERLQSHPSQKERINAFIHAVAEGDTQALEREFLLSRGSDTKFEQFLIMLRIAKESEGVDDGFIDEFVGTLGNDAHRILPFERNKLRTLRQIGYL